MSNTSGSSDSFRKLLRVLLPVALAAIALTAFAILRNNKPLTSSAMDKITIAQAGDFFLYAPLYVALDAGIFAEERIDASLTTTGGDDKTWASVISGSAQFGVADPTFIAISAERGQPGLVVATLVNGVPFWGVTFRDDIETIDSPSQLGTFSVATFPSPSTAYTLQAAMFRSAGLEPQIVQGAFGTLLSILDAKRADIALELEPNVSVAVKRGARVVYSLADIYGDFAITGLTTTPEIVLSRKDLVNRVVRSLTRAMRLIREDRQRSLDILVKRFPEVEPAIAAAALNRVIADGIIPLNAITSTNAWDKALKLRIDAGDLKAPRPFLDYVNNSFAADAAGK